MRQLLMVQPDETDAGAFRAAFRDRQDELEVSTVPSLDHARRELTARRWDAVLLCPGLKRLSLASFVKAAGKLSPTPQLLLVGDEEPGYLTLGHTSAARVADEVLSRLSIARSSTVDAPVIEDLGIAGWVEFKRVAWPGAPEPLLRAQIRRTDFDESLLAFAQRAGQVQGPGLATTIESFWDDPRPHLLQDLPPGVSLARMLRQRREWGIETAMAVVRGMANGVSTLHAHEFSAGTLRGPSVWLTEAGEVLLLGHGLTQLPAARHEYYGIPGEAPPEEFGMPIAPKFAGDAFRLGILAMDLAVNDNPMRHLSAFDYLQRNWEPVIDLYAERFGSTTTRILELLLQPSETDRPRDELLKMLLDEAAPREWAAVVRDAVAWSKAAPALPW